ncbi:MAG: hypothetical protein LBP89_02090 [Helicobacteraceae bacterium]|nr:hypothetical protein [Helicobacteraceae bacterium]
MPPSPKTSFYRDPYKRVSFSRRYLGDAFTQLKDGARQNSEQAARAARKIALGFSRFGRGR